MDTPTAIPSEISDDAQKAAVNFMDVCTQHVMYIVGKGLIADEIQSLVDQEKGILQWPSSLEMAYTLWVQITV
jgi:hypothetical protein